MSGPEPLYLGFDLSTQQLKGIAVTSDLRAVAQAIVDFDGDFGTKYGITKGVLTNEKEGEVFAPVAMWLEAVDLVLQRLKEKGLDFGRIKGVSGAGMQHGSVYWSSDAEKLLGSLDSKATLLEQLSPKAFSHDMSPNWQDASTQAECDQFDAQLGSPNVLAERTGSKAHHRFTGPQILRFRKKHSEAYKKTSRISLVSSFLASIFLGKVAAIDISDVGGMNLYDIKEGKWDEKLLALAAGDVGVEDLKKKLGEVREDGGGSMGPVSQYFVARYGFNSSCAIAPFTGDNPSTILALPLRSMDAMVSLGTSTTFLMSTPKYVPDPAYHFMNHPTTPGLYMFMLCYKNGGLAREHVRNAINEKLPSPPPKEKSWDKFNELALSSPAAGQKTSSDPMKMGLFFPRPEIVPNLHAGTWRFEYDSSTGTLEETAKHWNLPEDDARAIIESQMLSLRLRSHNLVHAPRDGVPPQPRRIYLVGGGSQNEAIARIAGEVLGGVEGVYRLDVGGNACALGAAYKAVWAVERQEGQTFEELIKLRWREEEFIQKIDDGYREEVFEVYGREVKGFEQMEKAVLEKEGKK